MRPDLAHPRRGRRRHGRHARRLRQGLQRARQRRRQRARHRAGRVGAQHLGGGRRQGRARARCARRTRASICRRTRSRSASSAPARSAACCSTSSPRESERLRASSSSTCACAASCARSRCCWPSSGVDLERWREQLDSGAAAARPGALRRARARRPPAAHGDHRLHAPTTRSRSTIADWLARGIHVVTPNKKANSGDAGLLRLAAGGAPRRRRALSVRGHGRRRPAGHPDAARPARDRRRDHEHRGHLLGHAGVSVQRLRRQRAVLRHRARSQAARLHRARSARRPLGHGCRAQADHPRARDGPAARDDRRRGREPGARGPRDGHAATTSWPACRVRRRDAEALRRRGGARARCCATWAASLPTARRPSA